MSIGCNKFNSYVMKSSDLSSMISCSNIIASLSILYVKEYLLNKNIPQVQIKLQDIPSSVGVDDIQLQISVLDKTESLVNNNNQTLLVETGESLMNKFVLSLKDFSLPNNLPTRLFEQQKLPSVDLE